MAQFYGKNSGYLKRNDLKYFSFSIGLVLLVLIIVLLLTQSAPPTVAALAALACIIFIIQLADPFIMFFKRKSNQFYRGWGGELDIKKALEKLPDDFTVFQDVIIGKEKGNIDFVVLGKSGLFILEVKSHKGEISYNGSELTINGRTFRDKNFFRQVHGQTWALKNYLKQQTGEDIFIHSAIVFSSPYARMHFGYNPISNIYIIQKDFLLGLFDHFQSSATPLNQHKITQAMMQTVSR